MTCNKSNKEKIKYLKSHPDLVYKEYIENGKTTVQLAEEWQLPKSTVYSIVKSCNLVGIKFKEKVNYCDESLFELDNPIFCYMAGLISADGYIDEKNHRVCIRMAESARDMLEKLREYFSVSNSVAAYNTVGYSGNITMYDLTVSSKKLLERLAQLNIHGRKKDLLVRFPDMNLLSDECQEMYMRGLWDGDGAVYNDKLYTSILEESQLMIDSIKLFIECKLSLRVRYESGKKFPSVYISGKDVLTFYEWLYRNYLDFKIEYKYDRYLKYSSNV